MVPRPRPRRDRSDAVKEPVFVLVLCYGGGLGRRVNIFREAKVRPLVVGYAKRRVRKDVRGSGGPHPPPALCRRQEP